MPSEYQSRRDFLKNAGIAAAALTINRNILFCNSEKPRPNIIYIMTDDHGYQAISCYNGKINKTPHIDRLAKEGIRFNSSFCTNSICGPSRAVLLTGKYSHINGMRDNTNTFDGSQITFPKLLQQAGYETAIFGKWHLKSDPTGFDYWNILPGQGAYYNPGFIEMGINKKKEGYVTDIITDDCLNWLTNRKSEKPFCVLLHHKAPHRNWMPDKKHVSMYEDVDIPLPDTFYDDYSTRSDAARKQKMRIVDDLTMASDLKLNPDNTPQDDTPKEAADREMWKYSYERMNEQQRKDWDEAYNPWNEAFHKSNPKGEKLAEWKYQRYIKDYLRCIASVDDNIGRILDYLDTNGLKENTIVVYTSDQGFYLGEHGWFDKRFMYEESLKMPLIIRYPREITPGVNDSDMVLNLDFAPTLLDFAGVEIPKEMQGMSMKNILKGVDSKDWRQSIYYHYFEYPAEHSVKRHYGIRTKRYKLIHFYFDVDAWEFYDLEKDKHELKNQYDNPEYKKTIMGLKTELEKLQRQYKDTDYMNYLPKEEILKITHKAVGCNVKLRYPYSSKYTGGNPNALTDGIRSPKYFSANSDFRVWQGFEGYDMDAIVDLGKIMTIQKISTGFLQNQESWIFSPTEVIYEASLDGINFQRISSISQSSLNKNHDVTREEFIQKFNPLETRYIRVLAKNIGVCPDWHSSAGGKAWIFADEIIVE
jgi:arylsulfatase A-like enzyme